VKTGFIRASGFNLVTSVHRGDTYLVGVIIGGRTAAGRDQQMMDMLDNTFASLATRQQRADGRRSEIPPETQAAHNMPDDDEATTN
jgi:D-alanyl-D-alanine carboxypeptidase